MIDLTVVIGNNVNRLKHSMQLYIDTYNLTHILTVYFMCCCW